MTGNGIEGIDAIVLWATDARRTAEFYRCLGVPLEQEQHEEGAEHFAGQIGPVHFAIYGGSAGAAPMRGLAGAVMTGFRVDSLDSVFEIMKAWGAPVLFAPEEVPWGRRCVLLDPDGRSIELNEAPRQEAGARP